MGIAYVVVRHSLPFKALLPTGIHGSLSHPWTVVNRMVLFFLALLLSCFTLSNGATRITVAVMSVIMSCLIVWSVLTAWQSDDDGEVVYYRYSFALKRAGHRILTSVKRFALSIFRPRLPREYHTSSSHSLAGIGSIPPVTEHQDRSA